MKTDQDSSAASTPWVSVVIPARNRQASIARAVRSADAQRGFPAGSIEIIVVDDGSSDLTVDAARQAGVLASHQVSVLPNSRRPGANGARNTGILAARAPWIALLDSDDSWAPDKLALQLDAVRRTGVGAATCSWVIVRPGRAPEYRVYPRDIMFEGRMLTSRLAWSTGFATPTFLVHRDLIALAGLFDEDLRRRQDYEWTIRLARHSGILAVADAVLLQWRQAASITGDSSLVWPATRSILRKHRWLYARHPGSALAQVARAIRLRRSGP